MTWVQNYIGLPYRQHHCWGLVRKVYAEQLGVTLPAYGEISASDLIAVARQIARDSARDWQRVEAPAEFDVAVLRARSGGVHVGVVTQPGWMLHTEAATDAVHVPISHLSVRGRITGFWRLP